MVKESGMILLSEVQSSLQLLTIIFHNIMQILIMPKPENQGLLILIMIDVHFQNPNQLLSMQQTPQQQLGIRM